MPDARGSVTDGSVFLYVNVNTKFVYAGSDRPVLQISIWPSAWFVIEMLLIPFTIEVEALSPGWLLVT